MANLQAKKRRKKNHAGNQSGSETGVSSENPARLQHPVEMYRGGLLSEGGHGLGATGDATGSESSAAEGFYYSSGGGSGRGSVRSSSGTEQDPVLNKSRLLDLAQEVSCLLEQHECRTWRRGR